MNKKSGLADSPFFAPIKPTSPQPKIEANTRTPERVNARSGERPNSRTGERKIVRHSFNIYADQIDALRRLVAQKALQQHSVSLSDLVREAIDDLLNQKG